MRTEKQQKDLESTLRTFRNLVDRFDDMDKKLNHIIENLREQYLRSATEEISPDFLKMYDQYDRSDEEQ